jgi:hypothetical protein
MLLLFHAYRIRSINERCTGKRCNWSRPVHQMALLLIAVLFLRTRVIDGGTHGNLV